MIRSLLPAGVLLQGNRDSACTFRALAIFMASSAEGARFHDLYFVSEGAFAFFVMAMNYRLAADFFAVKGMRNLVEICEFYALFTRERRYDAHDGFA